MAIKNYILMLFSIILLNFKYSFSTQECKPKIAIIGAGIGGASAAHFLTELFNKNLKVDIYENNVIGGRLATIDLGKKEYEAGGSIIHSSNKYMKEFVELLNLKQRPPTSDSGKFGIWNGKDFVFEESNWESMTLLKLFYHYGLEPFYLHRYVEKILSDFEIIYELQNRGIAFNNVTAMLSAMNKDFPNLLQVSIRDHLIDLGYSEKLIDELVKATLVVNYGQDTDIQAFVSLVSVAGAGFDLWSVKSGNKEVPKHLISTNDNISVIYANVSKIYRYTEGTFTRFKLLFKQDDHENNLSDYYDIVIIATPMTKDHRNLITFELNGAEDLSFQFPGKYQTTYATFVVGEVNSSYFGLEEELQGILSCDPVKTIISSIGKLSSVEGEVDNNSKVWKIFSRQKLEESIINKIFTNVKEIKEIEWKAYPNYLSPMKNDNFKLDKQLYYVNAIEWAASAMEMSALSGRNAAILAFNDYQLHVCTSVTEKEDFINIKKQAHFEL